MMPSSNSESGRLKMNCTFLRIKIHVERLMNSDYVECPARRPHGGSPVILLQHLPMAAHLESPVARWASTREE